MWDKICCVMSATPGKRTAADLGILASVLYPLSVLPMFVMTIFAFDAPGSERNPYLIGMKYAFFGYALSIPVAVVLLWVFYKKKHYAYSKRAALFPLLFVGVMAMCMALIIVVCGGQFVCD